MPIATNAKSFKEFYYLEESLQEDLLSKWKDLKQSFSSSKNFEIDNLKKEIKSKVILLKNKKSELLKNFLKVLIDDLFTKKIFSNPIRNRSIILWLLSLLAIAGLSTLRDTTPSLEFVDYTKIKDAVDNGEFETPKSPETSEKISKQIIQEIRWGSFENRKDFVNQVKKYESDSGNPLTAYFDRTQTSIGFGTKARAGETSLSPEEAHNRLIDELEENEKLVHRIIKAVKPKWALNQNQWNALIDISFNVGSGELTRMLKKSATLKDLGAKISKITHATKKDGTKVESQNLIKRRVWENQLLGNI